MKVAVLRFQGDVYEHLKYFAAAGAETFSVKNARELENADALVLPGGESTTISKFLFEEGFDEAIKKMIEEGKGIFATCAGLILLANEVFGNQVKSLSLLNISVLRNAYGRQKDSFEAGISLKFDSEREFTGVFIRAPKITRVGHEVEVLGELDNEPVLVRQGKILAATFHPELTEDLRIAKYFLSEVCGG
ncbi:MAG: pyridoxal 5'-phosphate synthase glutaminase subunit PdxT [Actinobacteria bacterium]|nr:pyridoxal 5'-phosphate synthase glutaminase subunit PdxT [Actinomycetota bacterium]